MSFTGPEAHDPTVDCADLFAYDEEQLVRYLYRHGTFDVSTLIGVTSLSKRERDDLGDRICKAAQQHKASKAASPLPFSIDDLHTRLQNVASARDARGGSPDFKSPQSLHDQDIATELPSPRQHEHYEKSCRQELIRDGGRPICSYEELSQITAAPMEGYEVVLPWLSHFPDTETGAADLSTVFSRQFRRWWKFRRSQWDSRGLGDSEAGFVAYLEADRRQCQGAGETQMTTGRSYDQNIRKEWQRMSAQPRFFEGQTFTAYNATVKRRLAPHHFTLPLQLRKDPQKQTAWTDWLEYLNFELRWLEIWNDHAESLELEHHQAIKKLREAYQAEKDNTVHNGPRSDLEQAYNRAPRGRGVDAAKGLAAAQASLDLSRKSICDFLWETHKYTVARRQAMYQRHRVDWVIKEAHVMETEMIARKMARGNKRERRDEDSPEPQPKRTRIGNAKAPVIPHSRRTRSSRRRLNDPNAVHLDLSSD